jgi:hypothetical protein
MIGSIGGAIFGGIGFCGLTGPAHTLAHAFGGAASGAANGAITGGNIGMNALIGGLSAGTAEFAGNNAGFLKDVADNSLGIHLTNMIRRSFIGSVIGGGVSTARGGSFGYGAAQGAKTSAIAYAANEAMHEAEEIAQKALNISEDKSKLAPTDINIDNNASDTGCKGKGCINPFGGAKFKWYDITSWLFPGTNYCGTTKSGSGNTNSYNDFCCRKHDECIRNANSPWWKPNWKILDCHDELVDCFENPDLYKNK